MQPENHDPVYYADALISLGQACNALHILEEDILKVMELLRSHPEMRRFITSDRITAKGKTNAIEEILEGQVHETLIHFLAILSSQGQLANVDDITRQFLDRSSALREHASGDIHTSVALLPGRLELIQDEVGRILGKRVRLRHSIVPGILGGIYVRVGDFVIDGTIDRQLDDIRKQLLR